MKYNQCTYLERLMYLYDEFNLFLLLIIWNTSLFNKYAFKECGMEQRD